MIPVHVPDRDFGRAVQRSRDALALQVRAKRATLLCPGRACAIGYGVAVCCNDRCTSFAVTP